MVECRICNRQVAGSNRSLGYFAPRSTQPSIPPWSVNEYQLRLGRQRQVWLIPIAEERVGVQVKLLNPLRTHAIPERFCGGDSLWRGAISSVCTFTFTLFCTVNQRNLKPLKAQTPAKNKFGKKVVLRSPVRHGGYPAYGIRRIKRVVPLSSRVI